jgi:Mn-dependent DtxR family transcriptional regulator
MLGLRFDLTPAQVRVLLLLEYGHRETILYKNTKGEIVKRTTMPLELSDTPSFLLSANSLTRKSLMIFDEEKGPVLTDEGRSILSLIYKSAKAITDLVEAGIDIKEVVSVV